MGAVRPPIPGTPPGSNGRRARRRRRRTFTASPASTLDLTPITNPIIRRRIMARRSDHRAKPHERRRHRLAGTLARSRTSTRRRYGWYLAVYRQRGFVFRRAVSWLYGVPHVVPRGALAGAQTEVFYGSVNPCCCSPAPPP